MPPSTAVQPGERFVNRDGTAYTFQVDTNAAVVRRLVAEGLFAGPRGQHVNEDSAEDQQKRRIHWAPGPEVLDRIREAV